MVTMVISLIVLQLSAKQDAIIGMQGQLDESHRKFSDAGEEISRLEEQLRDLGTELSASHGAQENLQHNVSTPPNPPSPLGLVTYQKPSYSTAPNEGGSGSSAEAGSGVYAETVQGATL